MFNTRRNIRSRLLACLTVVLILLVGGKVAVGVRAADGSKGKPIVFDARVPTDQGDWYFKMELEPILFRIVAVENKYKVLRINIFNRSKRPLQLSLRDDRLQIVVRPAIRGERVVDASFDISRSDSAWWNSLDSTLQRALAYPDQAALRGNEEENVFAFVRASDLPSFPEALRFTIRSYSAMPIVIPQQRLATAQ